METTTVTVKLNEVSFYDEILASILYPTSEFKFLSYLDNSSVRRVKLTGV